MSQFFVLPEKIKNNSFIMDSDESHHVLSVMRHAIGAEITIFDGQGNKYLAKIEEIKNKLLHGRILETIASPDYKIRLNLCFSVVSKLSIDFILKHCTEIGVHSFQPVISERTQFKMKGDSPHSGTVPGLERFRKIFISACKQSGRAKLPVLKKPRKFAEIFKDGFWIPQLVEGISLCKQGIPVPPRTSSGLLTIVAHQNRNDVSLIDIAGKNKDITNINLIIGPEGGFSPSEIELAQKHGGALVSFGKYTLRTEVACIVASSMILNLLEK